MKIIDLLNKIANGEEVPEKIKYGLSVLTLNEEKNNYLYEDSDEYYGDCMIHWFNLNDKVEIIEEKKIPEKLTDILRVDDLIPPVDENMYKIWKQTIKNQNKINEICDYLKSKGE